MPTLAIALRIEDGLWISCESFETVEEFVADTVAEVPLGTYLTCSVVTPLLPEHVAFADEVEKLLDMIYDL